MFLEMTFNVLNLQVQELLGKIADLIERNSFQNQDMLCISLWSILDYG